MTKRAKRKSAKDRIALVHWSATVRSPDDPAVSLEVSGTARDHREAAARATAAAQGVQAFLESDRALVADGPVEEGAS